MMGILEILIVVLIAAWLLGMGTGVSLGGLIHFLLVVAVIVLIIRLVQGSRVV